MWKMHEGGQRVFYRGAGPLTLSVYAKEWEVRNTKDNVLRAHGKCRTNSDAMLAAEGWAICYANQILLSLESK